MCILKGDAGIITITTSHYLFIYYGLFLHIFPLIAAKN